MALVIKGTKEKTKEKKGKNILTGMVVEKGVGMCENETRV